MKKRRIALWLGTLVLFGLFLAKLEDGQQEEGRRQLEEAVRRAAVSGYALEGVYPASIEQMKKEHGLRYDESRYVVYYEYTASNLMPQITVVNK